MHDVPAGVPFDPDLDIGGSEQFSASVVPVPDLDLVPVNPYFDPPFRQTGKSAGQIPVSERVHGDIDPFLGPLQDLDVDGFEVLPGGVMFPERDGVREKGRGLSKAGGKDREEEEGKEEQFRTGRR